MADDIVVGLDIGTTKVSACIAEYDENDRLQIVGLGTAPSEGLRRGVVINIESTLRAVLAAVENAEQMAGREVESVITGIAGGHIESLNSRGVVAVTGKEREVSRRDVDRVIEAAKAVVIPMDREVLHVIPQEFVVDDQGGVKNPVDMMGVRLEAQVHIITGSVTAAQNLVKCVNRAGLRVDNLVLDSLAASKAVLTKDERELGVLFLDLGGGTTNLLVYAEGAPYYTAVLPVGGAQVTSDISIMLKTPMESAERLKREAGCCFAPIVDDDEPVIIPGVGGRPPLSIQRRKLAEIVQPRMAEILAMARDRVAKAGFLNRLGGGVVLTGGGALLPGAVELTQEIFKTAGRVGKPGNLGGVSDQYQRPEYSTVVGLVLFGEQLYGGPEGDRAPREKGEGMFGAFTAWLRNFFE